MLPSTISLALLLGLAFSSSSFSDDLNDEIRRWRPGEDPPHRLLAYPSGKLPEPSEVICSFSIDSVWPYISDIEDERLLEELLFDIRSERETFAAALTKLIESKGLPWLAAKLDTRASSRWELQWLRQMVQSPAARVSVAFVDKADMPESRAESALLKLKQDLDAGLPWSKAYRSIADANPDIERMRKEPGTQTTLITYAFGGWVSSIGFSYSSLFVTPYVPPAHFEMAISAGLGGHIIKDQSGVYLLYVFEVFRGAPGSSLERMVGR